MSIVGLFIRSFDIIDGTMKTIKTIAVSLLFVPVLAFAQGTATSTLPVVLPSAGLTPESAFYFFDRMSESLRELFTFSQDAKAKLQIAFASERISEIKDILETKGIEAKGLDVAQARLQANLERVNAILAKQKTDGKDVSVLAKKVDDDFDGPKSALKEAFKTEKRALEVKIKELKAKISEAQLAGNTAQVEALGKELDGLVAQKELLKLKSDKQSEDMDKEEGRLEEQLDDKEEAQKAINEAEKEKQEVMNEAAKDGVIVTADAFKKFDQLLSQAKELFTKENYQGSKQLAKQAKKSLEDVKDNAENLKEEKEQKEELKKEREENSNEEAKKSQERDNEEAEEVRKDD